MKTFVAVCLLACAVAFPQDLDLLEGSGEPPAEIAVRSFKSAGINDDDILRSEFEMSDDGQFQYGFETRDGTVVDAAGENRQIGDSAGIAMRGSYSYTSPEGIDVTVQWEADEAGFRASGPQVPKVPEYVTRLLKSLPAEPQPAVPVSSTEDAAVAPAETVVPAAPAAVFIVPTILVEDAPAEVEVPVADPVFDVLSNVIEAASPAEEA